MRGSPILRACVALLVLLGLGYPLHRMLRAETGRLGSIAPTGPVPKTDQQTVHLQISFTEEPQELEVVSLGNSVWKQAAPGLEAQHDLTLAYPHEGIDLLFKIAWPADHRAAARVTLMQLDGREQVRYIWGQGAASDVLTFH